MDRLIFVKKYFSLEMCECEDKNETYEKKNN